MSLSADKSFLRKKLRAQRQAFQGSVRLRSESVICQLLDQLIEQSVQQNAEEDLAKYIAVYHPFDGEVDLRSLWGGGFYTSVQSSSMHINQHRTWVFPVHQAQQALSFVSPHRWIDHRKLPIAQGPEIALSDIGIIIVPGVAFCDRSGFRLGLGGGHYDRTLALADEKSWSGLTFGVGFSFQIQSELPRDSWDRPLDGLVTELGVKMFT